MTGPSFTLFLSFSRSSPPSILLLSFLLSSWVSSLIVVHTSFSPLLLLSVCIYEHTRGWDELPLQIRL